MKSSRELSLAVRADDPLPTNLVGQAPPASPYSRWREDKGWRLALRAFVKESNRIEGIHRNPYDRELDAHDAFLSLYEIGVSDLIRLVAVLAPGKPLRQKGGMDVRVGGHMPPPGGAYVVEQLEATLGFANSAPGQAYEVHHQYETLHPFMDGNGRSGRALWLWMMLMAGSDVYAMRRGFLHTWYYQSLASNNARRA